MCNKCLEEEIEDLKAKVEQEAERANTWRSLWDRSENTAHELRQALSNTKAELSNVQSDLADTAATLVKYRDMRVKRSRVNSDLRKRVSDLEDTIRTLTEERDLARELFQDMVRKHAKLLDRYSKTCDDYEELSSRFIWRDDVEND